MPRLLFVCHTVHNTDGGDAPGTTFYASYRTSSSSLIKAFSRQVFDFCLILLRFRSRLPQATFFATDVLAGTASLPIETTFLSLTRKQDYTANIRHLRSSFAPVLARTGVRFLSFDHVWTYSSHFLQLPTVLCGALGGAAGGLNEVVLHSLVLNRRLPTLEAATSVWKVVPLLWNILLSVYHSKSIT